VFVKRLFHEHRSITCTSLDVTFAFGLGLVFKMADRGVIPGSASVIAIGCAASWLIGIFVIELVRPTNDRMLFVRALSGILRSARSLATFAVVGFLSAAILPDPAGIYLHFRHHYVQANWMTDPLSRLAYFPLDYTSLNGLGRFPRNFYLLDKDGNFRTDRFSDRLISPACPEAKYDAKFLGDGIYIVRFYIDDVDEPARPCLVTPQIPATRNGSRP
jgi:hypothetical protein